MKWRHKCLVLCASDLKCVIMVCREKRVEENKSAKIKILILYAEKGANYLSPRFWLADALLNFSCCYRLTEYLSQIATSFFLILSQMSFNSSLFIPWIGNNMRISVLFSCVLQTKHSRQPVLHLLFCSEEEKESGVSKKKHQRNHCAMWSQNQALFAIQINYPQTISFRSRYYLSSWHNKNRCDCASAVFIDRPIEWKSKKPQSHLTSKINIHILKSDVCMIGKKIRLNLFVRCEFVYFVLPSLVMRCSAPIERNRTEQMCSNSIRAGYFSLTWFREWFPNRT